MTITTAFATSAKKELLLAGHNFAATVTPTATAASASTSVTSVSSMAGISTGSAVTGTGIAGNTTVAAITSATALTLSIATTAAISGGTLTISGDVFKVALIKPGMAGTFGAASVNYSDISTDETTNTSGTAYTAGGLALTNVAPATGSTTAYTSFVNPSWNTATFSTAGCMIYNSSVRNGGTSGTNTTGAGRCVSCYDFGGTEQVSAGTFSILMPTNDSVSSVIRIA